MSEDKNKFHVSVAHDGGNGYMKDQINSQRFTFPSVIATVLPGQEPQTIDTDNSEEVGKAMASLYDHMDVTVQSKGVNINGRYLVGKSAQIGTSTPISFNVNSNEGKSTSDISIICLLSLLATNAVTQYFTNNGELPNSLDITVDKMDTALPIDEIKLKGVRDTYTKRFADHPHIVILNNFSVPITVTINFINVDIQPEGIIAANGLIADPSDYSMARNDGIFDSLKEKYNKSFSGQDILKMGNILGIDIGDGTIDFSVTNSTSTVPTLNSSILMGIGNATENAIQALHQNYPMIGKITRQQFMDIANRGDGMESQTYKQYLDTQLTMLEQQIIEQIKSIYRSLNGQIGLIFLCGGGSIVLKEHFEDGLAKTIESLSPFETAPILWVDRKFAQNLNLDGLEFRLAYMK